MKTTIILLIALSFSYSAVYGQAGALDTTFGNKGIVETAIDTANIARVVMLQSNNKILVGGVAYSYSDTFFSVVRYNQNGTIDKSYGNNGIASAKISNQSYAMYGAMQSDGKVVMIGTDSVGFDVIRFDTTGHLDTSFNHTGKECITIFGDYFIPWGVAIQPNGAIIIIGDTSSWTQTFIGIIRLKSNGAFDLTFNKTGYSLYWPSTYTSGINVTIQSDGKILVLGAVNNSFFIGRLNTDGTEDLSFGTNGGDSLITTSQQSNAFSAVVLANNKIIVTGQIGRNFAVVRYTQYGKVDSTFGNNGIDTFPILSNWGQGKQAILQKDNKILICGYDQSYQMFVLRLLQNGHLDSTFGINGIQNFSFVSKLNNSIAFSLILQPDNKILVAGGASLLPFTGDFFLLRLLPGLILGTLDFKSKTNNTLLIYPNPLQNQATLEYTLTSAEIISIDVYDIQGKCVKSLINKAERTAGTYKEDLNFNGLISGEYIIKVNNGQQGISVKFIKL